VGPSENTQAPPVTSPAPELPGPADRNSLPMASLFASDIYLWIIAVVAFLVIVLITVLIATSVSRKRF
jgi:hypothetical protein